MELAAAIPPPPPDESNEAIIFARKTLVWTFRLAVGFIGVAVVYTFILQ
ncbi:MAG: hypothetical protein OXG58_02835 [Gemmatimonadetes bacterium]|nr:hypothetical protein [Gemmatimonadota bacterium]MCY3943103.1 hypothetical protein [Gemmatimonadota bacterium]